MKATKHMKEYFNRLKKECAEAYEIASTARAKGYDPETHVEIKLAENMAERVVGLISVIAPQIVGSGVVERIIELEKEYCALDWRVALKIAEEVAQEKFCKFKDKKEAMETGIRVGFAYGTVGVVSSPLEGFVNLDIKKRNNGKGEYFCINYAGPVRNAGGTAASWSVIIADYIRVKNGYAAYDPTAEEIKRCSTEIGDYHERVTNLQYFPSKEESEFLMQHLPVEVSGDPSEDIEVSNYKDLPRVSTNKIRSGYCLIHSSCIPLKAPKLWAQLSKWGKDFGMAHWNFLDGFLKLQKEMKAKSEAEETQTKKTEKEKSEENQEKQTDKPKVSPDYTYVKDLVAGRPVLSHPLEPGGFRLRYGRSRLSGYSAQAVHPATMHVLNNFIATGTQLKVERPGKGAAFSPCDCIEGPVVKLNNGSVLRLMTEAEAKAVKKDIKEVLFIGDVLVNYGDFLNRAHTLVPPGYCEEWWVQDLEKQMVDIFGSIDAHKLSELVDVSPGFIEKMLKEPMTTRPSAEIALQLSKKADIPLHPFYTFHYRLIDVNEFLILVKWLSKPSTTLDGSVNKTAFKLEEEPKEILEKLGIPHKVATEYVVFEEDILLILNETLGLNTKDFEEFITTIEQNKEKPTLEIINYLSAVKIRDKSGVFIGGRMGRPEKAKMRKMTGSPHVLFPVGAEGGRLRSFQSAVDEKKITSDFALFRCSKCNKETVFGVCEECGNKTEKLYICNTCGKMLKPVCPKHGENRRYSKTQLDIVNIFNKFSKKLEMKQLPDLIKGVKGTSNKDHIPEHLIKGILRAKHNIFVNKDGTTRYDCSELPVTHFRPKEIRTSVERLRQMGYEFDYKGRPLTEDDQLLELKPQDIIIPCCPDSPDAPSDEVFFNVANFIDELLVKFYGLKPLYNLKSKDDLAGHLVVALAPHTSAAALSRIIGFSKTQGFLAHPYLHAACRRDCDGDECCIFLLMDAFLNFSKQYLPDSRGSTMDAPLVLTSILNPAEVDDMAFDIDIVWKYTLEFYKACEQYKKPWDIKIKLIKDVLGTPNQYECIGFTHDTDDMNAGVLCSAYKILPSMEDKLKSQMELAEKLRCVDEADVARLVIEKHFIRDIKGNLRKFSQQQFRCVKCNEKFRRPPLSGKCTACGGKIIFTISEGSIVKYLGPSISLAEKYEVPIYLKQTLELTKRRIEGVFGKEKEKQEGLGKWFG